MKYAKYILIVVFVTGIFLCLKPPVKKQKTEYLLDTVITVTAYGKGANIALDEAFSEIKRIDDTFSAYKDGSEISKINKNASGGFVKTTEEVFSLIKKAVLISEKTNGAFDITLKPISDLWGIGTENARIPDEDEIDKTLEKCGYKNLELDEETHSIFFKIPNMAIDLGAIAKGYASSRALDILKENGIKSALLDLGGNVAVIGNLPLSPFEAIKNGSFTRPFKVGIQNPLESRGNVLKTVTASDNMFIITSGNYERYFEKDGIIYHHIIDPKTGYPAKSGIKSATVITKDGAEGYALSTAAFFLGEKSLDLLSSLCEEIILIDDNLNIKTSRKD